jgi:hypothetical protein
MGGLAKSEDSSDPIAPSTSRWSLSAIHNNSRFEEQRDLLFVVWVLR